MSAELDQSTHGWLLFEVLCAYLLIAFVLWVITPAEKMDMDVFMLSLFALIWPLSLLAITVAGAIGLMMEGMEKFHSWLRKKLGLDK